MVVPVCRLNVEQTMLRFIFMCAAIMSMVMSFGKLQFMNVFIFLAFSAGDVSFRWWRAYVRSLLFSIAVSRNISVLILSASVSSSILLRHAPINSLSLLPNMTDCSMRPYRSASTLYSGMIPASRSGRSVGNIIVMFSMLPSLSVSSGLNIHWCGIPGTISHISPALNFSRVSPMMRSPLPEIMYVISHEFELCSLICSVGFMRTWSYMSVSFVSVCRMTANIRQVFYMIRQI